jgi:hypothetical protein
MPNWQWTKIPGGEKLGPWTVKRMRNQFDDRFVFIECGGKHHDTFSERRHGSDCFNVAKLHVESLADAVIAARPKCVWTKESIVDFWTIGCCQDGYDSEGGTIAGFCHRCGCEIEVKP